MPNKQIEEKKTIKEYLVTVDVSFSKDVEVVATSEENAIALAKERVAYLTGYPTENMDIYSIEET